MRTTTSQQADRILDAASRLFAERRFHEVLMDEIALVAGVGKGTLYRYFHTKEDLYLKLLERASEQYRARLRQAAESTTGARGRLVAVVTEVLAYFDEQPHLLELIQRAEVDRGPGTGFPWLEARRAVFHLVSQLFAEGNEQGEFAVADPELAMMLLLGGLRTILRFGEKPRPADLPERVVDALVQASAVVS